MVIQPVLVCLSLEWPCTSCTEALTRQRQCPPKMADPAALCEELHVKIVHGH